MAHLNRRSFLTSTLICVGTTSTAAAIEPIRREGGPRFRLSVAAYSFRQALDRARTPPAMTLEGFIDLASTWPVDAVELTGYYFPQTTPEHLARLKGRATRQGLDISGTAVRSDFCLTNAERLRQQIDHVKAWIEHTSRLGGKTIRIFAGSVQQGDTAERAQARCVEAIEECCHHAGRFGVYVALENHGGITGTADGMLSIVRAVRSEWFGVNLDTGNFITDNPYADLARIAPYAVTVQMKTEIQRAGRPKEEADLRRLFGILRDANYRGYVALEYEADGNPRDAVPAALRTMREICG
jgi:sugar phosphate isomerase/epimerase